MKALSTPSSKRLLISCFTAILCTIASCNYEHSIVLSCPDETISLYANDEYIGNTLTKYSFPSGIRRVEIVGVQDGVEIYRRTFYKETVGRNTLIDIQPISDMQYSNGKY